MFGMEFLIHYHFASISRNPKKMQLRTSKKLGPSIFLKPTPDKLRGRGEIVHPSLLSFKTFLSSSSPLFFLTSGRFSSSRSTGL